MKKKKFIVTAAPPTSNGDLHIGHLAGPFLGADVFTRIQRMLENDVLYISYGDDLQDYVDRKAHETNSTSENVANHFTEEMRKTLILSNMLPDHFPGTRKIPEHKKVMEEIFTDLYTNGDILIKNVETFYCNTCKRYEYEAYARGNCHYCGESSDANYCEKCGQPQESGMLENATCITCTNPLITVSEKRAYFPLTKYKDLLTDYYQARNWRPDATKLCETILENQIDAPLSRKIDIGIEVPFEKLNDHILDTWYGGPAGYISASMDWSSLQPNENKWKDYWQSNDTKWVAFVGYDCTYSHGVLYPSMLMAQKKYTAPDTVITNKFYGIDGEKISTSRNHAIWGNDIFSLFNSDAVRLYLSLTAPESTETNFQVDDFKSFVNNELAIKWNTWITDLFNDLADNQLVINSLDTQEDPLTGFISEISKSHNAETFSLQVYAKNILDIAHSGISHYHKAKNLTGDAYIRHLSENVKILRTLAIAATPIMTEFSSIIKNLLDTQNKHELYMWEDLYKESKILIKNNN